MSDPAKMRIDLNCQIDFLFDFSDAGGFGFFGFLDLSSRKFPQTSQQSLRFTAGY